MTNREVRDAPDDVFCDEDEAIQEVARRTGLSVEDIREIREMMGIDMPPMDEFVEENQTEDEL